MLEATALSSFALFQFYKRQLPIDTQFLCPKRVPARGLRLDNRVIFCLMMLMATGMKTYYFPGNILETVHLSGNMLPAFSDILDLIQIYGF